MSIDKRLNPYGKCLSYYEIALFDIMKRQIVAVKNYLLHTVFIGLNGKVNFITYPFRN